MMAELLGIARTTYDRLENGDPSVAIGTYMMALFVLGRGTPVADLADPRAEETGTLLESEHLPKRVRPKREPQPKGNAPSGEASATAAGGGASCGIAGRAGGDARRCGATRR